MARSDLAIIIPALNEEESIENIVVSCSKYGDVIVVNDGSVDKTGYVAMKSGAFVLNHVIKRGYDEALNTGFAFAFNNKYSFLISIDADGQHDPSYIPSFVKRLNSGFDIVIGKRQTQARFSEYLFSYYTKYFWDISDPLSGLKGYKSTVYKSLGHFDSYQSIGTELLLFALKKGYKIGEMEIKVKLRKGNPRFGSLIKSNLRIIKSLLSAFFKNYNYL